MGRGYYDTKVMPPPGPAQVAPRPSLGSTLEDRIWNFSVPELREILREQDVTGRGLANKEQMVDLLVGYLVMGPLSGDLYAEELISRYEERFGRGGTNCR